MKICWQITGISLYIQNKTVLLNARMSWLCSDYWSPENKFSQHVVSSQDILKNKNYHSSRKKKQKQHTQAISGVKKKKWEARRCTLKWCWNKNIFLSKYNENTTSQCFRKET